MILLDTNVVSEMIATRPDRRCLRWLSSREESSLHLSVVSGAEMLAGIAILPEGRRRSALHSDVVHLLSETFDGRILAFGAPAAVAYARVRAVRRAQGRPISTADAMIAATALATGASLATRNVRDFEGVGLEVIDPWSV